MGEGAAFFVLERWDHAQARGARLLGELLGYGSTCDAYHIVAPNPDTLAIQACMRMALADARLAPSDIGHINAHGTSTRLNDQAEARAIAAIFGERTVPVTAPKGVLGHLIGGSGPTEAVVALQSARLGVIPPIANLTSSAEAHLVDLVAESPRTVAAAQALSNSFGFGGHNACLVVAPPS